MEEIEEMDEMSAEDAKTELFNLRDASNEGFFRATGIELPKIETLGAPPVATSSRKMRLNLSQGAVDVDLPEGDLFYPCSATNFEYPERQFGQAVAAFRYADPYAFQSNVPGLRQRPIRHELPSWDATIGGYSEVMQPRILLKPSAAEGVMRYRHTNDGIAALHSEVEGMSVFYSESDGGGESGSCIAWFGISLFALVLSKLQDGGLIVAGRVPSMRDRASGLEAKAGLGFNYSPNGPQEVLMWGRRFERLGTFENKNCNGQVVWRVTSSTR